MKKTISVLLVLVMSVCAISVTSVTAVDYTTYNVTIIDNGDGTATINVAVPAGIASGKVVVSVSDNLTYIEDSISSDISGVMLNPNYNRNNVKGICAAFASVSAYAEDSVVLSADYTIGDVVYISEDDVTVPVWNLSNGSVKLGTEANGGVIKSFCPAYYTVEFRGLNGTILKTISVEKGDSAVAPTVPELEGYEFLRWDTDFSEVLSVLVVNAEFNRLSYQVVFMGINSSVLSTQTIYHGEAAEEPTAPAVVGYNYLGWDKSFDSIKDNIIVNAIYEKKEYTVEFIGLNDEIIDTQTIKFNESATAPGIIEEDGYNFIGWDKDFSVITGNLTVRAIYQKKTYQVTYVVSGSGHLEGNTVVEVEHGTDIATITAPTPVADKGHAFKGWNITEGFVTGPITIEGVFEQTYELGDVDSDGLTDNLDAAKILCYDANILEFNDNEWMAGDVNLDGSVNNMDARIILQFDVGIIDELRA